MIKLTFAAVFFFKVLSEDLCSYSAISREFTDKHPICFPKSEQQRSLRDANMILRRSLGGNTPKTKETNSQDI